MERDDQPPNSDAIERAVLGSILISARAFHVAARVLAPEDFFKPRHVSIFDAMRTLAKDGRDIDPITVWAELKSRGTLEEIDGISYITSLVDHIPDVANVDEYVRLVKDYSNRRALQREGQYLIKAAATNESTSAIIAGVFDRLNRRIATSESGLTSIDKVMRPVANEIEERNRSTEHFRGIRTGYPTLDAISHGWQHEQTYLIAAYSSVGKTALAVNLIRNALMAHDDLQVLYYSLEMSQFATGCRFLAIESGVDLELIRSGLLVPEQWAEVAQAAGVMAGYRKQLFLNTRRVTISNIAAECRAMAASFSSMRRMVVIDYIQLVQAQEKERKDLTLRSVARDLLDLSKELYCPVLIFAQLNGDEMERIPDFRPWASDLRDAKALRDESRMTILMSRPWVHRKKSPEYRKCFLRLLIDKHSEGDASEDVDLHFIGSKQIIREEDCPSDCPTHLDGSPFPTKGFRKKTKKPKTDIQKALEIAGFEKDEA